MLLCQISDLHIKAERRLAYGVVDTASMLEQCVTRMRGNTHLIALAADSFQIGCTAREPVLARNMVDTISQLFVEKSLQASRREATAAVNFIQKEVDHYREALERMREALAAVIDQTEIRHIYLVGGSLTDGRKEGERFLQLARFVKKENRYGIPVSLGSGAIPA
jgi:hypothetical protein